jgi:predicted DNA binding CopG/RHH family protein
MIAESDAGHPQREMRYYALGETSRGRRLFVAFTVRRKLIRVILVRDMKKRVPEFRSEDQEREFWATQDSTEYIDWSQAKRRRLADLKPSLRTISLRLPVSMIKDLKVLANKRDVPYQSLLKVFLAERLAQEHRRAGRST